MALSFPKGPKRTASNELPSWLAARRAGGMPQQAGGMLRMPRYAEGTEHGSEPVDPWRVVPPNLEDLPGLPPPPPYVPPEGTGGSGFGYNPPDQWSGPNPGSWSATMPSVDAYSNVYTPGMTFLPRTMVDPVTGRRWYSGVNGRATWADTGEEMDVAPGAYYADSGNYGGTWSGAAEAEQNYYASQLAAMTARGYTYIERPDGSVIISGVQAVRDPVTGATSSVPANQATGYSMVIYPPRDWKQTNPGDPLSAIGSPMQGGYIGPPGSAPVSGNRIRPNVAVTQPAPSGSGALPGGGVLPAGQQAIPGQPSGVDLGIVSSQIRPGGYGLVTTGLGGPSNPADYWENGFVPIGPDGNAISSSRQIPPGAPIRLYRMTDGEYARYRASRGLGSV